MKNLSRHRSLRALLGRRREGSVTVIFATSFIVLLMLVGLAIDFSFYNEAETQLNMAADSAAIHAVRVAVQALLLNQSNYIAQGQAAGQDWFTAQAGNIPRAKVLNAPTVSVSFNSSTNLLTAQVNYTGSITSNFGFVFPGDPKTWNISGGATAVQSANSYIEFDMMLDNSSSMLIAANPSGIASMDTLTPCSVQAAGANQPIDGTYTWVYNTSTAYNGPNNNSSQTALCAANTTYVPYGFSTFAYSALANSSGTACGSTAMTGYSNYLVPPTNAVQGACDSRFTGPTSGTNNQCPYIPQVENLSITTTSNGSFAQCVNSSGTPYGGGSGMGTTASGTAGNYNPSPTPTKAPNVTNSNVPQAPCAFACHWTSTLVSGTNYTNDYYGLARQNGVQLRFDVVQTAAENVVQDLINYLPQSLVPAPFKVGVYTFNTALGTLYSPPTTPPTTNSGEQAELNAAYSAIQGYQTPVVSNSADTDFPDSMASLASTLTNAGSGATANTPRKNLFIVTDGMSDYNGSGGRAMGPIDTTQCQTFKNMGYTVYVLYTTYYPLPNAFYLGNIKQYAEPTSGSSITQALQSCASSSSTFFQASDANSINTAMQNMLNIALSSPGRLSQ